MLEAMILKIRNKKIFRVSKSWLEKRKSASTRAGKKKEKKGFISQVTLEGKADVASIL